MADLVQLMDMTEDAFFEHLRQYLRGANPSDIEPTVPVFRREDGCINRMKTLSLPCFEGLL